MSFDVFLQCFSENGGGTFPHAIVEKALGPFKTRGSGERDWNLEFSGHFGGTLYIDNTEIIDGFSVNRPGGKELYSILFELMKETSSVLFWGGGAATADPAIIPNVWPEMIVAMEGPPKVVHSVDELIEYIESN
jgi:hypothetical protein